MARLVIVSNRVPIPKSRVTQAGGLAVALRDILIPGALRPIPYRMPPSSRRAASPMPRSI
jgi:hypothetical protein